MRDHAVTIVVVIMDASCILGVFDGVIVSGVAMQRSVSADSYVDNYIGIVVDYLHALLDS